MASTEEDVDVVVVDQSRNDTTITPEASSVALTRHTKLYVHTGNIATWNSLKTRKTQV